MDGYQSPRWLAGNGVVGGNLQTIWPALFATRYQGPAPRFRRERWNTPDGDFIDLDWQDSQPGHGVAQGAGERALLVLFHGLEGSSSSHYALAFANWARENGWNFVVPHFRGCSGELNLAPRAYHSGDFEEIGWVLARLRAGHQGPIIAVGVSLGGNALLRWAAEAGQTAAQSVRAVCAISAPLDLTAGGHAIGIGFNRQVYTRMFLRTMVPKALGKLAQHPGLFDGRRLQAARDLYEFDNIF
ncbi:MAG TPA: alpha/beta fold hydrolase, partial [Rhizobacter sp.]|nr:alpha/beta fold hydrolase [Rhizobacter sp.]